MYLTFICSYKHRNNQFQGVKLVHAGLEAPVEIPDKNWLVNAIKRGL